MNAEGTPQNVHLRRIEPDQSIQGIDQIDDTIRNDAGRKWFVSQLIQPTVSFGAYDRITNRIELSKTACTVSVSNTSAATHTVTVTDGQVWQITGLAHVNGTRNPLVLFQYTNDGGTNWYPIPGNFVGLTVTQSLAISCVPQDFILTGVGTNVQVRCNDTSFVAADVVRNTITYRRLA